MAIHASGPQGGLWLSTADSYGLLGIATTMTAMLSHGMTGYGYLRSGPQGGPVLSHSMTAMAMTGPHDDAVMSSGRQSMAHYTASEPGEAV
eukprot:gene21368-28309_t